MSAVKDRIRRRLLELARRGETTTYSEVGSLAALGMDDPDQRKQLADLLTEICREEHAEGRPLLSALVVMGSGMGVPGRGFVKLARELGVCSGEMEVECFVRELRRVFEFWGKHSE